MPNQNPSGPNQPLSKHPLPNNGYYALAADANLITGLEVGTDYLLIPPPPEGAIRQTGPTCVLGMLSGATGGADWELVWRLEGGAEAVIGRGTLASPDDISSLYAFAADIYLSPTDEGIFVRFTAITDGVVSASASWSDVRPVEERSAVPLVQDGVIVSFSPETPDGLLYKIAGPLGVIPTGWLLNTDDVDHDVRVAITDGVNTVDQGPAATVTAGDGIPTQLGCINLPPGWRIQGRLVGSSQSTSPLYAVVPWILTNQGPARQDQGGAY